MGFYLHRTPRLVQWLFNDITWKIDSDEKAICLSFDDGPSHATNTILEILRNFKIKAVFFCQGKNLKSYPELSLKILEEGHVMANHGYHHFNGWDTDNSVYQENIAEGQRVLESYIGHKQLLYRPPYGKLTFKQYKYIINHRIVMWSLMSGDFDPNLSAEACLEKLKRYTLPSDIVVFHDQFELIDKLKKILPEYIEFCLGEGYKFDVV